MTKPSITNDSSLPATPPSVGPQPATAEQIDRARENYAYGSDDCIEIDTDAITATSDDGVWIQGWFWLPNETDDHDA